MLVGLPRSGTTWAANWLTTDRSLCIHDPLNQYHYQQLDNIECPGKTVGISCTGIYLWTDWLNKHPARKVIVHRSVGEIKYSLREAGIQLKVFKPHLLDKVEGFHVHWQELWTNPGPIYKFLLKREYDVERHTLLKNYNIQMDFNKTPKNIKLETTLIKEIRQSLV